MGNWKWKSLLECVYSSIPIPIGLELGIDSATCKFMYTQGINPICEGKIVK